MKKNEVKREFRIFTISDYDKEEEFLREQHKAGFKFVRFSLPGFYYFEACEPEDVIYQLDFSDTGKGERGDYLQLYQDTGWEYMFDVNGWSYFRKPASSTKGMDYIFSDKESKISLISRVFKRRMIPLMAIFVLCILPEINIMCTRYAEGGADKNFAIIFLGIFCVLFLWYVHLLIHCGKGLLRLKREVEEGVR